MHDSLTSHSNIQTPTVHHFYTYDSLSTFFRFGAALSGPEGPLGTVRVPDQCSSTATAAAEVWLASVAGMSDYRGISGVDQNHLRSAFCALRHNH